MDNQVGKELGKLIDAIPGMILRVLLIGVALGTIIVGGLVWLFK